MIASSRKPGRGSRRRRKWKAQRLFLARQRNQAKRGKVRKWTSGVFIRDDERVTPKEYIAEKTQVDPVKAKKGIGFFAAVAALVGLAARPFRRGAARGR
jgi:hypothetical protein